MIDWLSLLAVAGATLAAAAVIVTLFATGIKLFATPSDSALGGSARDDETDEIESSSRPMGATIGGIVCFVLTGIGVLYGIYLIVPALHG